MKKAASDKKILPIYLLTLRGAEYNRPYYLFKRCFQMRLNS